MNTHIPSLWVVSALYPNEVHAVDAKSGHELRCVGITEPADARLIAATPDLLAACDTALAYLTSGALNSAVQESAIGRVVVAQLTIAIAKASGPDHACSKCGRLHLFTDDKCEVHP